jgi:Thrombospondin type 3 repeat
MRAGPRRHLRKALLLAVLTVCTAAVALPASALAAPPNDNYLNSAAYNTDGSTLPASSTGDRTGFPTYFTLDQATQEADLMQGSSSPAIPEPNQCQRPGFTAAPYTNTVWFDIYPHRAGTLTVYAAATGFQPMVGVVQWDRNTGRPDFNNTGQCEVASLGVATLNYAHRLVEGAAYSIVVGYATAGGGTPGPFDLQVNFDADTDRDGVNDSQDACPNEAGTISGCPDSDGDGIRNSDDSCPTQAGPAGYRGCPDSDGDGIPNPSDGCPTVRGSAQYGGCRDSDGDGRADPVDKCPTVDASERDKNKDGCLDPLHLERIVGASISVGLWSNGVSLNSLKVTHVPAGARVSVACKLPGGRGCGKLLVKKASVSSVHAKAARNIRVRLRKHLPYHTLITIRVTARQATGKFIQYTVVRRGDRIARTERCMNQGSTRPRKKGCK